MKAIVLKSIPFKENQKIVTLFSEESGLVSMLIKGISSRNAHNLPFGELFTEAFFLTTQKKSDLHLFQEGEVIDLHLLLREQLRYLQTASAMGKALLHSQLPGKPSSGLYRLFSSFLKQIPCIPCQNALLSTFYLKMLIHEGLYHTTDSTIPFPPEEQHQLSTLATLTHFSPLKGLSHTPPFLQKLESFFFYKINQ